MLFSSVAALTYIIPTKNIAGFPKTPHLLNRETNIAHPSIKLLQGSS